MDKNSADHGVGVSPNQIGSLLREMFFADFGYESRISVIDDFFERVGRSRKDFGVFPNVL